MVQPEKRKREPSTADDRSKKKSRFSEAPKGAAPIAAPATLAPPPKFSQDKIEEMKRELVRKKEELSRLAVAQSAAAKAAERPAVGPTPLVLDELGRTIDPTTGQPVHIQAYTPTLKANIRSQMREREVKTMQEKVIRDRARAEEEEEAPQTNSMFFDRSIGLKINARSSRSFNFFEPGRFEKIGQQRRNMEKLKLLQSKVALEAKKTGIETAAKLAVVQPKIETVEETPAVEWWDTVVLRDGVYPSDEGRPDWPECQAAATDGGSSEFINRNVVTHLIEHPVEVEPPADRGLRETAPLVLLTKEERKKLRRQERKKKQEEIKTKILMNLMSPPKPKVKLSNMMRARCTEAILDPTKEEAQVRAEQEARMSEHREANAARKLTKEERREKRANKLKEDTTSGVHVTVFKVKDFSSPKMRFKVQTNASQLHMTGIVVVHAGCTVIVAEGGPKQQKKFKRLVLNRINWNDSSFKARRKQRQQEELKKTDGVEEDDDDCGEEEESSKNGCQLVWEGTVKSRAFGVVSILNCPTEAFAKEQFRKHSVQHYWDLAFSTTVLENTLRA